MDGPARGLHRVPAAVLALAIGLGSTSVDRGHQGPTSGNLVLAHRDLRFDRDDASLIRGMVIVDDFLCEPLVMNRDDRSPGSGAPG